MKEGSARQSAARQQHRGGCRGPARRAELPQAATAIAALLRRPSRTARSCPGARCGGIRPRDCGRKRLRHRRVPGSARPWGSATPVRQGAPQRGGAAPPREPAAPPSRVAEGRAAAPLAHLAGRGRPDPPLPQAERSPAGLGREAAASARSASACRPFSTASGLPGNSAACSHRPSTPPPPRADGQLALPIEKGEDRLPVGGQPIIRRDGRGRDWRGHGLLGTVVRPPAASGPRPCRDFPGRHRGERSVPAPSLLVLPVVAREGSARDTPPGRKAASAAAGTESRRDGRCGAASMSPSRRPNPRSSYPGPF